MPKAKRAISKARRSADGQLELTDQSWRKVSARSAAVEPVFGEIEPPPRKLSDRLWNALGGLGIVPFAWICTAALFNTFAHSSPRSTHVPFWMSHDFLVFSLAATIWLVWFCVSLAIWKEPRPLRAYVLGHELMHMLMARLYRGRIRAYRISREGGYIVTNKYNFLIALAPYLWPFYSVPVLAAWSVSLYWTEAWYYREWFLGGLGFTWMFHLTFTLWVLPRGQSDLHGPGRIFSLALIYLANTILLTGALVVLAPEVTWRGYGAELWASTKTFYQWAGHSLGRAIDILSP